MNTGSLRTLRPVFVTLISLVQPGGNPSGVSFSIMIYIQLSSQKTKKRDKKKNHKTNKSTLSSLCQARDNRLFFPDCLLGLFRFNIEIVKTSYLGIEISQGNKLHCNEPNNLKHTNLSPKKAEKSTTKRFRQPFSIDLY